MPQIWPEEFLDEIIDHGYIGFIYAPNCVAFFAQIEQESIQ